MKNTRKLATMSILIALSIVLVTIIHFPIFPQAAFLEYDPADIPILICGFAFGPVAGITVTLIASLIQGLTVSAQSSWYGIAMHIVATGTYVTVASAIYRKHKTRKGAAISLACGTLAMVAIMIPANLVLTAAFTGMPAKAIWEQFMMFIVPFNLIKAGANGLITFIVYKSISKLIHRFDEPAVKAKAQKASN